MEATSISDRMKDYYESRSASFLTRRIPVIIRIDGRSFSSFCRRFTMPYDPSLHAMLNGVMEYLCKNIQGTKFAQRHSDEMSFLLTDYDTNQTDAFFDYSVQKVVSIVASMATAEFCRQLMINGEFISPHEAWPQFDARAFSLPEHEIVNYFHSRQIDCIRNSISMQARAVFSHKETHGKTGDEKQEMLFSKGVNWGTLPQEQKTGFVCLKETIQKPIEKGPNIGQMFDRTVWGAKPAPADYASLKSLIESIPLRVEKANG